MPANQLASSLDLYNAHATVQRRSQQRISCLLGALADAPPQLLVGDFLPRPIHDDPCMLQFMGGAEQLTCLSGHTWLESLEKSKEERPLVLYSRTDLSSSHGVVDTCWPCKENDDSKHAIVRPTQLEFRTVRGIRNIFVVCCSSSSLYSLFCCYTPPLALQSLN